MRPRLTARAALATALLTAPLTALLTALTALAPAPAHAQDPAFRVVAVPWVPTNPAIPHDGVAGQPHYLQAVADHCPAGPITLRWDYDGDGRYDMPATPAPDRWNLGAQHTYNPAETRLYYPRVEARCADATATAQMPLRIHVAPPLQIRINRAISNGLWIGHAQLIRDPATLRASFGAGDRVADSAALAQAMINRGHRAGADPATTPYLADVQWQLHTALAGMVRRSIRARQAGADTDLNGNGDGLRFAASENYVGGGVLEALASYGDLRYVPPPQTALPGAVVGRALGEVVQDAAEYFAWSQSEIPFNGAHAGGWSYAANSDDIDSSHVGWAAVGLFAAQRVGGAQIPDFVAERLYQGVLHNDTSRGGNEALRGGYVYRFGNDTGPSYARSGAMLNALGYATDRDPTDPQVQATVGLISRQWGRNFVTDYWDGTNLGNYYAMHQIAKGMRSFEPAFEYIGDAGVDWYADYATFLVDTQPANARWINDHQWTRDREITHALGLLVLIPTLFEAIPTAVPQGAPLAIGPDDPVTFTHAESYALDPLNPIVMYRWDFVRAPDGLDLNADGRFDAPNEIEPEDLDGDGRVSDEETHWEIETADPTFRPVWRFPLTAGPQQTYEVRLQVEDTLGRTHTDRHTITVTVSTTNHPPVAVPHPQPGAEYLATPGQMLRLDAAQSYDPDTDDPPVPGFPRDALTTTWDLDGDGVFETPGPITQLAIPPDWADGLTRIIRLRACDDGRWIGQSDAQCGGDCSLCHTADARIRVALRPDAIVEPATTLLEGDQIEIDGDRSNHPRAQPYTLTWTLDPRLPYTLGPGGRSILIDATQIDGPQTFNGTLTATTAGLTDTAPFTITVQNRAPTITVRAGGRALEGTTLIWTATATDAPADRDDLRYSFDCEGDGIFEIEDSPENIANCLLDDGPYTLRVRVTDGDGGEAAASAGPFVVPNAPPTLTTITCPDDPREGVEIEWLIEGTDPGLGPLTCALAPPAPDATALDACRLRWTPTYQQAIAGPITFTAIITEPDGLTADTTWQCDPTFRDLDLDTLPDTWEEETGTDPTLDDCAADPDADGATNCDEFAAGTHPLTFDGPEPPELLDPIAAAVVPTLTPELTVRNARTPRAHPLTYDFALFTPGALDPLTTTTNIPETPETTRSTVPEAVLQENATYEWTARAHDTLTPGPWAARETFSVDTLPEPPTPPTIRRPEPRDATRAEPLVVELDNGTDPDPEATLIYECQFAATPDFDPALATGDDREDQPTTRIEIDGPLPEDTPGFIRCRTLDNTGLASAWSETVEVTINNTNALPTAPQMIEPAPGTTIITPAPRLDITLIAGRSTDVEPTPLTYRLSISDDPTFPPDGTFTSGDLTPDPTGEVRWRPPALATDRTWHWRARAHDGLAAGPLSTAEFKLEPPAPDLGPDATPTPDLGPTPDPTEDLGPTHDLGADQGLDGDIISGFGCACDATDPPSTTPPATPLLALALIALITRPRRRRR